LAVSGHHFGTPALSVFQHRRKPFAAAQEINFGFFEEASVADRVSSDRGLSLPEDCWYRPN